MTVRVEHFESAGKAELPLGSRDQPAGNDARATRTELLQEPGGIVRKQPRLVMEDVARGLVEWRGPALARGEILEQLDAGTTGRAQRGNAQVRAEDRVQPLLFGPGIFALAGDAKSEQVAIESEARRRNPPSGSRHDRAMWQQCI